MTWSLLPCDQGHGQGDEQQQLTACLSHLSCRYELQVHSSTAVPPGCQRKSWLTVGVPAAATGKLAQDVPVCLLPSRPKPSRLKQQTTWDQINMIASTRLIMVCNFPPGYGGYLIFAPVYSANGWISEKWKITLSISPHQTCEHTRQVHSAELPRGYEYHTDLRGSCWRDRARGRAASSWGWWPSQDGAAASCQSAPTEDGTGSWVRCVVKC